MVSGTTRTEYLYTLVPSLSESSRSELSEILWSNRKIGGASLSAGLESVIEGGLKETGNNCQPRASLPLG